MIKGLDTVESINSFFSDWAYKSESERLTFIRTLRSKGNVNAVTPSKPGQDNCPVNNFQVVRPCGLGSCTYHISSPQYKNCLFIAVGEAKNSRLNPDEIGSLLNMSLKEVNNHHVSAVKKIQRALIKETIELNRAPQFTYLKGHCIHCETRIQDEMDMGLSPDLYYKSDSNFAWCSVKCKRLKPENEFAIELELKSDFKAVLKLAASLASLRLPTKSETYAKIDQILDLDMGTTERVLRS